MATLVCVFKILCLFVDDAADQYHPADAYEGAPIIDICPDDRTVLNQQAIDSESETQRHCVLDVHGLRAYPGYGEKPLVFAPDMDRSDRADGGISISSIPEVATTRSAISSVSPLDVFLTNLPRVVRD